MTDKTNLQFNIGRLLLPASQQKRDTAEVIIIEGGKTNKSAGQLLFLFKIDSGRKTDTELVNTLQKSFANFYYNFKSPKNTFDFKLAFEYALRMINQTLEQILIMRDPDWRKKIHAVIAVLKGNELVFSNFGEVSAWVIHHKTKVTPGHSNITLINIIEQQGIVQEENESGKIFDNIINGVLSANDGIFFTTNNIFDYLPAAQLKQTLDNFSATGIAQHIHRIIGNLTLPDSIASIIIKPTIEEAKTKKISSQTSMNQFIAREKNTEQWLHSAWRYALSQLLQRLKEIVIDAAKTSGSWLWSKIKQLTQIIKVKIQTYLEEQRGKREEILKSNPAKIEEVKQPENITKAIPQETISEPEITVHPTDLDKPKERVGGEAEVKQPEETAINVEIDDKFNHWVNKRINRWSTLSRKPKVVLVLFAAFLFIFLNSLGYQIDRNNQIQSQQKIDQITNSIEDLFNQGTAATIYQQDDKARGLFQSALKLFQDLPDSSKHSDKLSGIYDQISKEMQRLKKIVEVDPQTIVAVENTETVKHTFFGLTCSVDKCFSLETNNTELATFDLKNKKVDYTKLPDNFGTPLSWQNLNDQEILILTSPKKIWKFTLPSQFTEIQVSWPDFLSNPIALGSFNQYIYISDSQSKQIGRFSLYNGKLTSHRAWFTAVPTSPALVIAIDSDLYLVNQNNEIKKYTKGETKDFDYSLEPQLSKVDTIFTTQKNKNIYITESYNSRVIVLDKKASLLAQYTSPLLADASGYLVQEGQKKVYFVTPGGLEMFEMK